MAEPRPTDARKVGRQPGSALNQHRERLRQRGLQRVEVQVRNEDAPLLRAVAAALSDPRRAGEARALLLRRFAPEPAVDLKALLEAAPLEGVDLTRSRETGRDIEF